MNLLTLVSNYPHETLGALVGLPLIGSWIGGHIGARTGTREFRRRYQRHR